MKYSLLVTILISLCIIGCVTDQTRKTVSQPRYIEVSKVNPSYFAFSDGNPYIPIGINLINPSGRYQQHPDSAFYEIDQWMKQLSENGGNYVRIWLSQSFWDMEEDMAGKYSDEKVTRIDRFFEMARKYKLRVKITLEHFRSVTLDENPQKWATKFAYHTSQGGPLDSIRQYITSEEGHFLFLDKVDFLKTGMAVIPCSLGGNYGMK
jgi:hypothetical protein